MCSIDYQIDARENASDRDVSGLGGLMSMTS